MVVLMLAQSFFGLFHPWIGPIDKIGKVIYDRVESIDHFNKLWPTLHSFVFMMIRPTAFNLKFACRSEART